MCSCYYLAGYTNKTITIAPIACKVMRFILCEYIFINSLGRPPLFIICIDRYKKKTTDIHCLMKFNSLTFISGKYQFNIQCIKFLAQWLKCVQSDLYINNAATFTEINFLHIINGCIQLATIFW